MSERAGNTSITSVSLSKEFQALMKKHGFSPTEMMRKGVAISLFELGDPKYNSETNKARFEAITSLLKSQELQEKLDFIEDKIKEVREALDV